MVDLKTQNQEIESKIKETAKRLFKDNQVDLIIGYSKGTFPLSSAPIFIRKEEEIEQLTWNNLCYVNLAKYLIPTICEIKAGQKVPLKVGVVSKGCVARAIIHLAVENKINIDNMKIIGIPCNGNINRRKIEKKIGQREILEISMENEEIIVIGESFEERLPYNEYMNGLCKTCKIKAPPISEKLNSVIIGASQIAESLEEDFADLTEYESKSSEEKWAHIKELLQECTRCYACREACPMCYCNLCFVDQNLPTWFGKTTEISDIMVFHMIRALHMAGRCVGCSACSGVCPIGIDLAIINRKLEKIVKKRFNFVSGLDLKTLPPTMVHKMSDAQEFMLEEE